MTQRDLRVLPKTHLHLHFSGSMRHLTLVELADKHGVRLPDALRTDWPPELSAADERGWFRFQRLYDIARSVLRTEDDVRRLVREAAEDDRADGSRWLEIQVDPSGYGARFGGITALGCTIGQGISGFSTLALGSIITFLAIVAGSAAAMKWQYWRMTREG